MDWDAVAGDTYYTGRKLEAEARAADDAARWREYAEIKVRKGSYALGIHGYLNVATRCERAGDRSGAAAAYEEGFDVAAKAKCRELAVILTYRLCQLHERARDWDAGIAAYERLGTFCEGLEAWFLAADAYEHAAELMILAGRDVTGYRKPIELWERNVRYWEEQGDEDDAVWSREHMGLYCALFGVAP